MQRLPIDGHVHAVEAVADFFGGLLDLLGDEAALADGRRGREVGGKVVGGEAVGHVLREELGEAARVEVVDDGAELLNEG